jgi:hypothetical protein
MQLPIILSVVIGGWVALVPVVLSLCCVARRCDDATDATVAEAVSPERPLRSLGLDHAATLLGVSPHTLLVWQARYGFPTPSPVELRYSQSEVLALRDCLEDGLSIASAVVRARQKTKRRRAPTSTPQVNHRDGGIAS